MNEHAKQKLADFLDKEVADKEIVIADLIDKVYDFAVSVERKRCHEVTSFGILRGIPSEYNTQVFEQQARIRAIRHMVFYGLEPSSDDIQMQIETERQEMLNKGDVWKPS